MKWFRHQSDSYSNLKLRPVLALFGLEGYGLFWICVELVAQQGIKYRIEAKKTWKSTIQYITKVDEKKLDEILEMFSEVGLIDKKALNKGILFIPKMLEYSDEYTKKVRREYGQGTDNISLHNSTLHNKIGHNSKGEIKMISPADIAREFFEQGAVYESLLGEFSEGRNREGIEMEFKKFCIYWTEPNKSGTKVRWEMQATFEIKRRLVTWLSRSRRFENSNYQVKNMRA